jgi:muramoyltetrapeptide carboxypeptidase
MTVPPYLKKGDTIGLTCPAGYMALDKVQNCIDTLQSWGYRIKLGNTLGGESTDYFSGTDQQRADDLQAMLDDPSVSAILFARGGYGMGRIIDLLNFKKFRKSPKWIIGFSDVTVMHTHLFNQYKIASLHAPMAGAFNDGQESNEFVLSLKKALKGIKGKYKCDGHPNNQMGTATGKLIGGNLALLTHVIGTPSDYTTKNNILFIEDIGEYLYNIDRMLYQLNRSGKLDQIRGLIFGGFTDLKDTQRPFGKSIDNILKDISANLNIPICFHFPVSHGKENVALKIGVTYQLQVAQKKVVLLEM